MHGARKCKMSSNSARKNCHEISRKKYCTTNFQFAKGQDMKWEKDDQHAIKTQHFLKYWQYYRQKQKTTEPVQSALCIQFQTDWPTGYICICTQSHPSRVYDWVGNKSVWMQRMTKMQRMTETSCRIHFLWQWATWRLLHSVRYGYWNS